jgi:hypothetical protein
VWDINGHYPWLQHGLASVTWLNVTYLATDVFMFRVHDCDIARAASIQEYAGSQGSFAAGRTSIYNTWITLSLESSILEDVHRLSPAQQSGIFHLDSCGVSCPCQSHSGVGIDPRAGTPFVDRTYPSSLSVPCLGPRPRGHGTELCLEEVGIVEHGLWLVGLLVACDSVIVSFGVPDRRLISVLFFFL